MIPIKQTAIKLIHEGTLALAQVERNGIKIDMKYLENTIQETEFKIMTTEKELQNDKVGKRWKKRFGNRTSFGSHAQLEKVIFDELGYKRSGRTTSKGRDKSDEAAFENVDLDFVRKYFECEKLKKALGTYLKGIQREVVHGYMHPMLDLHTAITYRSSSSRPNIQNFPVRNEKIGDLIRRCVIAPKGYQIAEIDYGGIEVCGSACYHKDPKMIKYIIDPTTDMHRDMAMQCYMLSRKEVTKLIRYCAKNKYVFPQFYGSWWKDCATSLWEAIDQLNLTTESGLSLKEHLKQKGIKSLGNATNTDELRKGTFQKHIQEVEQDFWGNRFQVYAQWKKDWWQMYLKRGWFKFKTGFVAQGLYDRKQVCNSPIQGSSFHCLLWSMIELNKWINEKKLKSKIIFEIHDSMGLYLHNREVEDVLHKAKQIMTVDILKEWKWIIVPLTIEAELSPPGGSWFDKKAVEIK